MSHNSVVDQQRNQPRRQFPWRWLGWSIPLCLLLVPLVAMQFTAEVDWSLSDFVIMGLLMGTVGMGIELAVRLSADLRYRVAAGLALLSGFVLIWVNLAVGIVGDEKGAANLLYFVVVAIGMVGAIASGFTAAGLARTLYMMVATLLLLAWVMVTGPGSESANRLDVLGVSGFFIVLFLVPGLLFQQVARDQTGSRRLTSEGQQHE